MRILIDMDDTLVKFSDRWYNKHNAEFGHIHELVFGAGWEDGSRCKDANCDADIFKYFNDADLWSDGEPLPDSITVTQRWTNIGHELSIITKVPSKHIEAAQYKYIGLQKHFSHITPIFFVNEHTKHWIQADVLIDDGIHNHSGFTGISLLYDQPWNRNNTALPRIKNWQHADIVIERINTMISDYEMQAVWSQRQPMLKWIQFRILQEIRAGDL